MTEKVNMAEVIALSEKIITGTEDTVSDFQSADGRVKAIDSMESFSGKTAKSVKRYLAGFHQEMFVGFNHLFTHMSETFKEHIETFKGEVDASDSAIIQSGYLAEIKLDMEVQYRKVDGCERAINSTLDKVSDIINLQAPGFTDVRSKYRDATERMEELEENFTAFFDKGKKDHNKSKELVSALDLLMKKAQYNTGDTRLKDFEGGAWSADQEILKKAVTGVTTGTGIIQSYAEGNIKDSGNPKQSNNSKTNQKTDAVKPKKSKFDIKSSIMKGVKAGGRALRPSGVFAPLGIAVDGVEHYHDAETQGLTGWEKTGYVVEETGYDTAISIASAATGVAIVAGGAALIGASAVSLPALGIAASIGLGLNFLANRKDNKTDKSLADRAKGVMRSGVDKIKGWFG